MNGNKALFDSNIIIYLSKDLIDIDKILRNYDEFYISIITYIEVLGFKFNNDIEKKIIEKLLNQFKIIHLDLNIAEITISIRQKKKIKLPDAIIFATAKKNNCDLITFNIDDFKNIDKETKVIKPENNTN